MATIANAYIDQSDEKFDDGSVIPWPAANGADPFTFYASGGGSTGAVTLPALACNPGDYILMNIGSDLVYTNDAGTVTIQFGTYWDETANGGTGGWVTPTSGTSGTTPFNSFSGPYASVAQGAIDLNDEYFWDMENYGTINMTPDPATGTYGITPTTGAPAGGIGGIDIKDGSLWDVHLHPAHHARGLLVNGHPRVVKNAANANNDALIFDFTSQADSLDFSTSDGSGDSDSQAGAMDGAYQIMTPTSSPPAPGVTDYGSRMTIAKNISVGGYFPTAIWPGGNPASAMIAFCTWFPGASSAPSVFSTGGALSLGLYSMRYCYYKSLTLKTNSGTITQTVETPLSVLVEASISSGSTNRIELTIPPPPSGWDGTRLYMVNGDGLLGPMFVRAVQVTAAGAATWEASAGGTYAAGKYTITSFAVTAPAYWPSYGFSAWPTGTLLIRDKNALKFYLMKWSHLSKVRGTTGNYDVQQYVGTVKSGQAAAQQPGSLLSGHFGTASAPAVGNVLSIKADGKTLDWAAGAGLGPGSILRINENIQNQMRGQFVNTLFYMVGSTTGSPTFYIKPKIAGTQMQYQRDDGTVVNLGTAPTGVVGFPSSAAAAGAVLLYKPTATSNVQAFQYCAPNVDLTNSTTQIGGVSTDLWMKIGALDSVVDPATNEYGWNGYHSGAQMTGSYTHPPETILNGALGTQNPTKWHHVGTSIEMIGSIAYINYGNAGATPSFISQIASNDGDKSYTIQPTFFSCVGGDWIYIETSGIANGGNVTPNHANSSSYTASPTKIVLCRVSVAPDQNNNYNTTGWHSGVHKIGPQHLKDSAITKRAIHSSVPSAFQTNNAQLYVVPGSTNTGAGTASVRWDNGILVDTIYGGNIPTGNVFPTTLTNVPANSMLGWVPGNTTLTVYTGNSLPDSAYPIARLSGQLDANGQYTLLSYQNGSIRLSDLHYGENTITRQALHPATPGAFTGNYAQLYVVPGSSNIGATTASIRWDSQLYIDDVHGAGIGSVATNQLNNVLINNFIGWVKGDANLSTRVATGKLPNNFYPLARLSPQTDAQGQYVLYGNQIGVIQMSDVHLRDSVVTTNKLVNAAVDGNKLSNTSVSNRHLNGAVIKTGNVNWNVGSIITGQDVFAQPNDGFWHLRNWAGLAPPPQGSFSGGNMGGFTPYMTHDAVEVAVGSDVNSAGTVIFNAWERLKIYKRQNLNGLATTNPPLDTQLAYVHLSPQNVNGDCLTILLRRFDVLSDGSVACEYYWNISGRSQNVALRFRAHVNMSA